MDADLNNSSETNARRLSQSLTSRAEAKAAQGQWDQAQRLFAQAVAFDPSPASLIAFAVAAFDHCRDLAARSLLERAWRLSCEMRLADWRAVCCFNLSVLHRRQGNLPLAKQFHQLALAAEMESPIFQREGSLSSPLRFESAGLFSESGEHAHAMKMFRSLRPLATDCSAITR